MGWLLIFIGVIFEVVWVVGLKYAQTPFTWIATFIALSISFVSIILATKRLPVGTVYAVFVGLGTVEAVLVDAVFFQHPLTLGKFILLAILLSGIVGVKIFEKGES